MEAAPDAFQQPGARLETACTVSRRALRERAPEHAARPPRYMGAGGGGAGGVGPGGGDTGSPMGGGPGGSGAGAGEGGITGSGGSMCADSGGGGRRCGCGVVSGVMRLRACLCPS
jgi:hypothetical protein